MGSSLDEALEKIWYSMSLINAEATAVTTTYYVQ